MNQKKNKTTIFSVDQLVSYVAILVGLSALIVSLYEASIFRKQQKAAVWPYLELNYAYNSNNGVFSYNIQNKGMGPAILEWSSIKIDDTPMHNWRNYRNEIFTTDTLKLGKSYIYNRVIAPGETVNMLIISDKQAAYIAYKNRKRISFEICYRSIFDEYWLLKRNSSGRSHSKIKYFDIAPEDEFED